MKFLRFSLLTAAFSIVVAQLSVAPLAAQTTPVRPPPAGPGSSAGTPPGGNVPTPMSSPSITRPTAPMDTARVILVTGKVVLENGQEPGQPVQIERICTGHPHPEGYTDPRGYFSIRLGQETEIPDASETMGRSTVSANNPAGGVRESQLAMCDLRVVLPGYRTELIPLANRKYMDNPDVGTVVLHRIGGIEGLTLSATTALAPKDAKKAYEHGLEAAKKDKPADAMRDFQKAVTLYPKYAAAWFELGRVQEHFNQSLEARNDYAQSIAADTKFIPPYQRLYLIAFREKKWQECAEQSDRVMHLNPFDYPGAYYYNAVANLEMGNLAVAEKSAREALSRDQSHLNPQTNYVLGIILAQKQAYGEAAQYLRAYLKAVPEAKNRDEVNKQLASLDRMLAKAAPAAAATQAPHDKPEK